MTGINFKEKKVFHDFHRILKQKPLGQAKRLTPQDVQFVCTMYSLRTALKRGAELRLLLVCKVVAAAPDYSLCDMKQTFQTTALNAQCMCHHCVGIYYICTIYQCKMFLYIFCLKFQKKNEYIVSYIAIDYTEIHPKKILKMTSKKKSNFQAQSKLQCA